MQKESGLWRTMPFSVVAQIKYGEVWISRDDDKASYMLQAGDAVCLAPGIRHKIDNQWDGINVSRWCHINVFILGAVDIMNLIDIPPVFRGETAQLIGDINEEMAALSSMEKPEFRHLMRKQMLGYQLAEVIVSAGSTNLHAQRLLPHLERISPVLSYIHENMTHPMSREELAHLIYLSPSRFYALFKDALGISPTDYIQSVRMQQAQRMLLNSGLNVHDIAASCGYPNAFHFSRLFKKRFGASPLQYRKNVGKNRVF